MDAFEFVRAVARFIDVETGVGAEKIVLARTRRSLKRVVTERDVTVAFVAALLETLPYERALTLFPEAPIASAKTVADRLIRCAFLRFEGSAAEAEEWRRSRGFLDCLRRTFAVFLDGVKRGRDQKVRDLEERVRILEAGRDLDRTDIRKISSQRDALCRKHEALKTRADTMAFLLSRSSILEVIVWALFEIHPDERDARLAEIVDALAGSQTPMHERMDQLLRLLAPHGKMIH